MTGGAGRVAGDVRGRALLSRRLGADGARRLTASPSLKAAVTTLAAGPYGRAVHAGQELAEADYAVGAALLWHLRVLAGWRPRAGAEAVRQLAGWFEIANVVEHARALAGVVAGPRYTLGRLTTTWSRLTATGTGSELSDTLATTSWPRDRRRLRRSRCRWGCRGPPESRPRCPRPRLGEGRGGFAVRPAAVRHVGGAARAGGAPGDRRARPRGHLGRPRPACPTFRTDEFNGKVRGR
jgi:hypothetical protein